jgi:Cu2+-exporting ATPase
MEHPSEQHELEEAKPSQDAGAKLKSGGHKHMDEHSHDHHHHHAQMAMDFRQRFWISMVLTLPIIVLSPLLQKLVGLREAISFSGDTYVLFGFSLGGVLVWRLALPQGPGRRA